MVQAVAYAVAYAFTYGSPCAVAYALVSYAEVAYTVSYDLLELNICVFLCLIRQLGLKAFSFLLLPKIAEKIYLLKASLHIVDILFDTRSFEAYLLDDPLR